MELFENDSLNSGSKDELCLSDLYALLQTSISSLETQPHHSIDTLTLLMEQICSQQESLQQQTPANIRAEFWRQVNATWIFVIESVIKSQKLEKSDWKVVSETVIAAGDVLCLYGLVDYPMGFAEAKIIEAICNGVSELECC